MKNRRGKYRDGSLSAPMRSKPPGPPKGPEPVTLTALELRMLIDAARAGQDAIETERAERPALVRALGKLDAAWSEWEAREAANRAEYDEWYAAHEARWKREVGQ